MAEQSITQLFRQLDPLFVQKYGGQWKRATPPATVAPSTGAGAASTALTQHAGQDWAVAHPTKDPAINKTGIWLSANFGIVGGSGVDESANLIAMFEHVGLAGGGRIIICADTHTDSIQLDRLVSIYRSNLDICFISPVSFGAAGGIRVMGEMVEYVVPPATFGAGLATGSPASEGDTTITLSTTSGKMQASNFSDGMLITMRGENDETGAALTKQQVVITSRNTGANTLTFAQELEYDFDPTYPSSSYGSTDATTIFPNLTWALAADVARGDMTATVTDSTGMTVGHMVRLYDTRVEVDLNAAAIRGSGLPYENECRLEYLTVTAIDSGTDTVTFDRPVSKGYLSGSPWFGGIADCAPVENVHIRGIVATYYEAQTSKNAHAISLNFAKDCTIENCKIDGSGGGMGQMFRISDSLNCWAIDCIGENPANHESGEGYIFTNYKSDRSGHRNCTARGGRHNFLMQACTNWLVDTCTSYDAWISGIDAHGVDEYDGMIINCRCSQMNNHPGDSSNGACVRIGNTSHYVGTHWTSILDCVFFGNYETNIAAIDFLAASSHLVIDGCKVYGGYYGIKNSKNPSQCTPPTPITDVIIRNCDLYNITNRPIYLEGVPDTAAGTRSSSKITGMLIEGCTDWNCTQHIHITGGDAITSLTVSDCQSVMPITSPGNDYYGIALSSVSGLMIRNNNFHLCSRGISLTNATNACVIGNTLTATIDATPITLAGTNTGPGGGALIYVANIVDNSSIASASTAWTTNASITNTQPRLDLIESDAATDEKDWRFVVAGGDLFVQAINDVSSGGTSPITLSRTGTTVDSIAMAATAIGLTGSTTITGALNVTGGITGVTSATLSGAIIAAADTDTANVLGRARIGYIAALSTDYATFAHYDHNSATNYAIAHTNLGRLLLNAVTGQNVTVRVNNTNVTIFSSTGADITGVITASGALSAAADTDTTSVIGRARVGFVSGLPDWATFAHYDHNTSANVGFLQSSAAATIVNAAFGQVVSIRNALNSVLDVGASGATLTGNLSVSGHFGAWTSVTFSGTWADIGGSDSACRYRKLGDIVFVEGVAERPSGTSTLSLFTLPSGYRPAKHKWFSTIIKYSGSQFVCRVEIATSGIVTITDPAVGTLGTLQIVYVMLDGIQFSTT